MSERRWTLKVCPECNYAVALVNAPVHEQGCSHPDCVDVDVVPAENGLRRTDDRAYDLRQRLNRAVRWLREAEDIARVEMPAYPTADRIREIYEQITEDVLNGLVYVPPLRQRLVEAEAETERLQKVLATIGNAQPWLYDFAGLRSLARDAIEPSARSVQ